MISFRSVTFHGDPSEIKWYFKQGLYLIFIMSLTGPGGNKHVSETEGAEIISDFDQNDELDIDIKLESCDDDENDVQNDDEEPKVIPIESSSSFGVQICKVCSKELF